MAVRFEELEAWQDESEPRRRQAEDDARSYAEWLNRGVDIVRSLGSAVLNDWNNLTPSGKSELTQQMSDLDAVVTQSRELLAGWSPWLDETTVRVYEAIFNRFAESVSDLGTGLTLRLREQAHRAESLATFAVQSPGFREGVEVARRQIADGQFEELTSTTLRERARSARH